ncbi:MAG: Transcriptional regulator, LysR family [Myxococcaceae bacterium]|nr:Transcriptional regulator, LysR family [Myxococcaceae bacterium]
MPMDDQALSDLSPPRLRAFLAVAEAHGFSSAARRLGQSQSSLSQSVAGLERELGQELFVRDGRSVHLTEAGRILKSHAERALSELARAVEALSGLRELTRGSLLLGTSDTLASYMLPKVFSVFRRTYPGVELRLDNRPSPLVAERVAQHRVDLGVVSLPLPRTLSSAGRPVSELLAFETLRPQREVVICSSTHRYGRRRALSFAELAAEPLVLLDQSTASRSLLEQRFIELGVRPRVAMEMSSVEVIKRLVELDFGLSVIPEMSARRELQQRTLHGIATPQPWPERHVGLITPVHGSLSHAARAFIEVLRTELPTRAPSVRKPT